MRLLFHPIRVLPEDCLPLFLRGSCDEPWASAHSLNILTSYIYDTTGDLDSCNKSPFPQALEYQVQQGGAETAREEWSLVPLREGSHRYGPPIHATGGVLRLLLPAVL